MTIRSEQFDVLVARATRILSVVDFNIPPTPADQIKTQMPEIKVGSLFKFTLADRRVFAVYRFTAWENAAPSEPAAMVFLDHQYQTPFRMSAWQFAWMAGGGRAIALHPDRPIGEQTALNLTPSQRTRGHRALEYVEHYFRICEDLDDGFETTSSLEKSKKEVAERRNEKAPSNSTIYRWVERLRAHFTMDRLAAIAPKRNPGNTTRRISGKLEEAIQIGVKGAISDGDGTWKTVHSIVSNLVEPGGEFAELAEEFSKVSERLLQRRLEMVDYYTWTYLHHGPEAASRISSLRIRLALPDHPLDVVDCDHSTLDVMVYDPSTKFAFGRPDVIVFRDRHCGGVIGFNISFGAPSFGTFLAGLKHTCFPKDRASLMAGVSWPWYGVPVRLGVDNAMHLIGEDIANAGRELGFQIIEYRPGRPWEKGAMERLYGILNQQLIHRLPGSTTGTPDERDEFDDEKMKAMPMIGLDVLQGFLTHYFGEVFNRSLHTGIGPLITLEDYPCDRWDRGIAHAPTRPPVDPEIFARLVGYTDQVTIQRDGVRLDHLIYISSELHGLINHPLHKPGKGKNGGTKYTAIRDPNRADVLYVRDPYRQVVIELEISDSMASYARGLTLYEHKMVINHHKEKIGKIESVRGLQTARKSLELQMAELHKASRKYDAPRQLAKFINADAAKIRRAKIVELTPDHAVQTHMNYADPVVAEPQEKKNAMKRAKLPDGLINPVPAASDDATSSPAASASEPGMEPEAASSPTTAHSTDEHDLEIEVARARNPGWDADEDEE